MKIHSEANASILGDKIIVIYDKLSRGPELCTTTGRHQAQYMRVEGKDKPALAMIDIKLKYIGKH